jgi:hypothetical protein
MPIIRVAHKEGVDFSPIGVHHLEKIKEELFTNICDCYVAGLN